MKLFVGKEKKGTVLPHKFIRFYEDINIEITFFT